MGYIDAIILGIVQGLTEFLPISSSGHLVIFEHLLNLNLDNIAFEVFVHFGTLLSVLLIYAGDIWQMVKRFCYGVTHRNIRQSFRDDSYFRLSIFILIGTVPAVLAGLFLQDFFESVFHNLQLVGFTLLVTGTVILLTNFIHKKAVQLTASKALLIGIAQSIAIFPGISRSGFTISCALFTGVSRDDAARFSFLLAVPAIFGATLLHAVDLVKNGMPTDTGVIPILVGFFCAFVVGYLAIRFLLSIIRSGKFGWFAPYCFIAGLVVIIFLR